MKKIIFIISFFWVNFSFGQSLSRTNSDPVKIDTLSTITYANGFRLVDGDWLEFNRKDPKFKTDYGFNAIPTQYFFFSEDSYGTYSLSRSINFSEIKFLKVAYQGQDFIVLHILKYSGRYKYPSIREDWYDFKEDEFFVLDLEEVALMKDHFPERINQAYRVVLEVKKEKSFRSDLDNFDFEKKVRLALDEKEKSYLTPKFLLDVFPVDFEGQKVVRFNYKFTSSYSDSFDKFKPEDFDNFYFEADWQDFQNFIKY